MITINTDKIAIFSDIHWGKSNDNSLKISSCKEFIDNTIDDLKQKNINTIFFLGDWFDHRNSINVNTLNQSYDSIKKICDNFQLYMIVGNHDTYFKNSVDVNSIHHFRDIKNLTIIDKDTEINCNGKNMLLCPWHFNVKDHHDKEYDYMFGHFEMNGVNLNGMVYNSGSYCTDDLSNISSLTFSGHFHTRKEYERKNGKIITVGCPFELDWGDVGNEKGYYILDIQNREYEFFENKYSPKHIKYYWSEIISKKVKLNKNNINNNYIKLIIDDKYNYESVIKLIDIIKKHNPITVEPDYIFSIAQNLLNDINFDEKLQLKMSHIQYILKYIDKLKDNKEEIETNNVDIDTLKYMAQNYYNKCEE